MAVGVLGILALGCRPFAIAGSALDGGDGGDAGFLAAFDAGRDAGRDAGFDAGPDAGGCYPGTTWVGDVCVAFSCADYPFVASCFRDGGALGNCAGGYCVGYSEGTDDCGAFGITCPPPTSCVLGSCVWENDAGVLFGPSCDQPCADPTEVCLQNAGCVKAACAPEDDSKACQTGNEDISIGFCCHGACWTTSDGQDCGACGRSCGPEGACVIGFYGGGYCVPARASCAGPASLGTSDCILPSGAAGTCCGDTCGPDDCPSSCSAANEGSACLVDAGVGLTGLCCASACVDVYSDPLNCGACKVVCNAGQLCVGGCIKPASCADAPLGSLATCALDAGDPGNCCGPVCVDTNTDSKNCGGCELRCPEGSSCSQGVCFRNGQVVYCDSSATCPEGTSCASGSPVPFTCWPPACDGVSPDCVLDGGGIGTCCGTTCLPWADVACGVMCPLGSVPITTISFPHPPRCRRLDGGAVCEPGAICPAGTVCDPFDQACEDLDCPSGRSALGLGGCTFGTGIGTCCGDKCVDVYQDPASCGTCGNVCPSGMCTELFGCVPVGPTQDCLMTCAPGSYCQDGQCAISCNGQPFCLADDGTVGVCCSPGFDNPPTLDFTCARLLDDPQNCGTCGNACPAGQTCENGACSGSPRCPIGREYGFCDLDAGPSFVCCPSTGCTDTARDARNCGWCGMRCRPGIPCRNGECG